MRHYEIVFLVHPDQDEQVEELIKRYTDIVTTDGGTVHRLEDWGMRRLAYFISQTHKAHYVMMNVECSSKVLEEIRNAFRFNDAIIRDLIIKRDKAITKESAILLATLESDSDKDVNQKTDMKPSNKRG